MLLGSSDKLQFHTHFSFLHTTSFPGFPVFFPNLPVLPGFPRQVDMADRHLFSVCSNDSFILPVFLGSPSLPAFLGSPNIPVFLGSYSLPFLLGSLHKLQFHTHFSDMQTGICSRFVAVIALSYSFFWVPQFSWVPTAYQLCIL